MFYSLLYLNNRLSLFYINYDRYFVQSQRVRRGVVNDYKKVFEEDKIDCLLAPVVSDDPITLAEYERSDDIFSEDDILTVGANLAGIYFRIS